MFNGKIDIVNKSCLLLPYLMHAASRLDSHYLIIHASKELL